MKYKVVSLIMIIPLVLMLCVFSAANIATLKVSIPVSSVTVFNEAHETINLAEGNELQIDAQVLPRNASNKGLLFASEEIQGQEYPNIEIDENGLIKANGNGLAKIIVTTKDGAYKKSFILEVTSTLATDMSISLNTTEDIVVGDEFKVIGKINPEEALDKRIEFSSSNSSIVSIDEITGECRALSSGNVTLTAVHENGLNGRLEKQIEVTVLPSLSSSLITFDGYQILSKKIYSSDFEALMEINFTKFHELGLTLSNEDIILEYAESSVEEVILTQTNSSNGIYKYNVQINGIKDDNFNLKAKNNPKSKSKAGIIIPLK